MRTKTHELAVKIISVLKQQASEQKQKQYNAEQLAKLDLKTKELVTKLILEA